MRALVVAMLIVATLTSCGGSDDSSASDTSRVGGTAGSIAGSIAATPRTGSTDAPSSPTAAPAATATTRPVETGETVKTGVTADTREPAVDTQPPVVTPGAPSSDAEIDPATTSGGGVEVAIDLSADDDGFCSTAASPLPDGIAVEGAHVYRLRCDGERVRTVHSIPVDQTHDGYLGYFDLSSVGIDLDGDWELEFRPQVDAASTQAGIEIVLGGDFDPVTMAITGYGVFASGTSSSTSSQHIQRYADSQTSTNLTDNTFPFTGDLANRQVWTLRHRAGGELELLIDGVVEDRADDAADDQTTTSGEALRVRLECHNGPAGPEVSIAGIVVRDHLTGSS